MIDYKNNKFKFAARPVNDRLQYNNVYNLCVLYRSVMLYKQEKPDDIVEEVKAELKSIALYFKYKIDVTPMAYRNNTAAMVRKAYHDKYLSFTPFHCYRVGISAYLHNNRQDKVQGLYVDTDEYYRMALEMYMDIDVDVIGFYFYVEPYSVVHTKSKKYSILWDIPIRNVYDLQPIVCLDTLITANPPI